MKIDILHKILIPFLGNNNPNFEDFYSACCQCFRSASSFSSIKAEQYIELQKQWPKGVGVYAVWEESKEPYKNLIYIGMTGKLKRLANGQIKLADSEDGFSKRSLRYHPYSFTQKGPFKNYFEYGPKHSLKDIQKVPHKNRYASRIPLKDIRVDCFQIPERLKLAPSLLEVLLLQCYFTSCNSLPIGNNQL